MQSRTKLVSLISMAAMVLVVASASAGTIDSGTFTTDAQLKSFLDSSYAGDYTHLFDMGSPTSAAATVNGVAFTRFDNPSGDNQTITHGNLTLTTVPVGSVTTGFGDGTNTNGVGVASSQGSYNLLFDWLYVHGAQQYSTASLSGLTPGATYDLRLYYRNVYPTLSQQTRSVDITFDVGGAEDFINIDENTPDYDGPYYASYLAYEYVASSTTLNIKLDHITNDDMSWVWCGMSNRLVEDVPEPSTLALLACGLLGLLAYAWRKRK